MDAGPNQPLAVSDLDEIVARFEATFPGTGLQIYWQDKGSRAWVPSAGGDAAALDVIAPHVVADDAAMGALADGQTVFMDGQRRVLGNPLQDGDASPVSAAFLPIAGGQSVSGILSLTNLPGQALLRHCLSHAQTIAGYVGVTHASSREVEAARERTRELESAYAMSAMGTSFDPVVILDQFLSAVRDVVPFDSATLALMEGDDLHFYRHLPLEDEPEDTLLERANRFLRRSPLLRRVIEGMEPLIVDDVRQHDDWIPMQGLEHVRSWAGIPMRAGNELVGVLTLDSTESGAYSPRELWLVSTLATHASIAMQNARLHAEIQRQVRELTTLYDAGAAINADLDRDAVLRTVAEEMLAALDAESCTILLGRSAKDLRLAVDFRDGTAAPAKEGMGALLWAENISGLAAHPIVRRVLQRRALQHLSLATASSDDERSLLQELALSSLLMAPLLQAGRNLGMILLGRRRKALPPFQEREIRLASNLITQAAAAIEHAHLYAQAQRRVDELSTFHEIVLQLNTPLELEVVLENITEAALRLIEANNLHIYLWDEETDEFTFCSALWRNGSRKPAVDAPRKDGLTATVVNSGEAVIIDNANNHPLYQVGEATEWGVQAIAGFPLKYGGRVIGAFTVTYVEPHVFTADERLLMNLLADQAAVAVENARIFSDAQQRLRSMSALVDMAKQVTGNLKVELVLQTTVQTLQKLLNARASTIALLSHDEEELVVEAAAGIKPQYHRVRIKLGEGVSGRAVRERRMIYIRDTYREPDFLFFDDVLRSLLVVPLITRSKVIGTLTVDSDRPEAFSSSDTQLLMIAAAQVSVAIANARLFEALEERAGELAIAYEELKENDRLKDELVQNVSHELRTPLTFIRGYVDLLNDGEMGELSAEQRRALQIVSEKTHEVTRLVEDIVSLQRIESANLMCQMFSMESLLASAVDCHRLSAREQGLDLVLRQPVRNGVVEADRGRINQVLDNLIGNAIKFSPDGGAIELRMIEREEDVLVVVSDEGIGMPEDKVNRIFERFYQIDGSARRRFGGAGIGLAIVKRIVDAHVGDIWAKSDDGLGSSFYFTIPKKAVADDLRETTLSATN